MSERLQMHAIFHGAVILLIGNLCGIPYGNAIGRSLAEDIVRGWRVAHTGGVSGGLSVLALGAVFPRLNLGEAPLRLLVWSFVAGAYSITFGFLIAAGAGVRGMNPGGPALNSLVHVAYLIGALGVLVGSVLFVYGALGGLRRTRSR